MIVSRCKHVFSFSPLADPVRALPYAAVALDFAFGCFWHDEGMDGVKSVEVRGLVDDKVGCR